MISIDFDPEFVWYAQPLHNGDIVYKIYAWIPMSRLKLIQWCEDNLSNTYVVTNGGGTMVQGSELIAHRLSILLYSKDDLFFFKVMWG